MIRGEVSGLDQLDSISARLRSLARPDLGPLVEQIRRILAEGNRDGLLAGTDGQGRPMAPLSPSTLKRRDGGGPPGVPDGENSPLIANFRVDATPDGRGGFTLELSWTAPGLQYLRSGTSHSPPRDPCGIRPETRAKLQQALANYASDLARQGGRGDVGHIL